MRGTRVLTAGYEGIKCGVRVRFRGTMVLLVFLLIGGTYNGTFFRDVY